MGKILIIEDDADVRDFVKECLDQDYQVIEASNGVEALKVLESEIPDLITLDLSLPDIEGLELCHQIKSNPQHAHIPIIILSGRGSTGSHTLAYKLGADIFVDKPFNYDEFKAIVDNRIKYKSGAKAEVCGDIKIDTEGMKLIHDNIPLDLTPKEFKIFQFLSKHNGQVVSREQILDRIWPGTAIADRTIDGHVASLRRKIKGSKVLIETVYSMGYKLSA